MTWLYQGILEKPVGSEAAAATCFEKLVIFAKEYNISDLADIAMDILPKQYLQMGYLLASLTVHFYHSTQTGSRLRRLYAKFLICLTFGNDRLRQTWESGGIKPVLPR
jgi:hypothetical protein